MTVLTFRDFSKFASVNSANMCFPSVQNLKFRLKSWVLSMFKTPQDLKSLTVNLTLGLFKQCSRVQIFCFFVERILMDSSYILWNKFQDYQVRFYFNKPFFGNNLTRHLQGSLNFVY